MVVLALFMLRYGLGRRSFGGESESAGLEVGGEEGHKFYTLNLKEEGGDVVCLQRCGLLSAVFQNQCLVEA